MSITSDFVKAHEGCKLKAYQDGGGVWTIGYGHTGPEVQDGMTWTQDQCDAALDADLEHALAGIEPSITAALSERQTAALTSLAFNVGVSAVAASTLLKKANARDWIGAAHEFPRWDHDGGAEVKGLLIRRFEEAALFLKGS